MSNRRTPDSWQVFFQRVELRFGVLIENRKEAVFGGTEWSITCESKIWPANFTAFRSQARDAWARCLRELSAGQCTQGGLPRLFIHQVAVQIFSYRVFAVMAFAIKILAL